MDLSRYEILWQGDLPPDRITMVVGSSNDAWISADLRQQITSLCERRREGGQKIENRLLYNILNWEANSQGLTLHLTTTCYEDYLGLGILQNPLAPWALTVAATTEIEGHLVLERRSSSVAQGSGLFHVKPSGHIHPPQDPWQALQQETWEELALHCDEIHQTRLRGLVRSHTANCMCLIFHQTTMLPWKEWMNRTPPDAWEAEALFGLPIQGTAIREWIRQSSLLATGPCLAALEIYLSSARP